jgi:methionine synthase I (cobalamin-dependent)
MADLPGWPGPEDVAGDIGRGLSTRFTRQAVSSPQPRRSRVCHGMMGTTPEEAAEALVQAGADVIGANCGQGIAGFAAICQRLRAATDRPIWLKPNAGMPVMVDGRAQYTTTPEEFAALVPELVRLGAAFIGGCCGTRPDFIAAIRRASLSP